MPASNSSFASHWLRSNETLHDTAVAANDNGRRYALEEMFDVWHSLQGSLRGQSGPESYKVTEPQALLHCELRADTAASTPQPRASPRDSPRDSPNAAAARVVSGLATLRVDEEEGGASLWDSPMREAWDSAPAATAVPYLSRASSFLGSLPAPQLFRPAALYLPVPHASPLSYLPAPMTSLLAYLGAPQAPPTAPGRSFLGAALPLPAGAAVLAAPPGFLQPVALVAPELLQWVYLDPSGAEQGPFLGTNMQAWYDGGFFTPDLQIRRVGEIMYQTLAAFTRSLEIYDTPFATLLPPVGAPPTLHGGYYEYSQSYFPSGGLYGYQPHQQPHQQPQTHQQPQSHQQPHAQPQPQSHQQPHAQPHAQPQAWSPVAQGAMHGTAQPAAQPNSPWMSRNTSTADFGRSLSPFVPQLGFALSGNEVLGTPKTDATPAVAPPAPINEPHQSSAPSDTTESDKKINEAKPEAKNEAKNDVKNEAKNDVKNDTKTKLSKKHGKALVKPTVKVSQVKPVVLAPVRVSTAAPPAKEQPLVEAAPAAPASAAPASPVAASPLVEQAPRLAPWASATVTAPSLTLKEIQAIEAKAFQDALALQVQADDQTRLLAARAIAKVTEAETRPALPATASWASASTAPAVPKKTLAEIQREEAAAAQAQALPQGRGRAAPPPPSFALLAGNAPATADLSWTVVGTKKPAKTSTATPMPVAVAPVAAPTRAPPSAASTPREEFLAWARGSLAGLNNGVNKEEVLTMLLMLPSGAESAEIIADTIYYNSSTMDGRRFASEFLKRRRVVEQVGTSDGSWSDALRSSKVVVEDNDGWGAAFKVVKKKGKKV